MKPSEQEIAAMSRPVKPTDQEALIAAAKNLRAIVEASRTRRWVDAEHPEMRLKDTGEWCAFYTALAKFNV